MEPSIPDGVRPRGITRRHLLHGLLFILAGLTMAGSYIILSEEQIFQGRGAGPLAGLVMVLFGMFLLKPEQRLLDRPSTFLEYYDAIVMAVGIALVVRTFVIEPFKIPSGSMIPTLLVGDYLFVNKMAYGHRVPFTSQRVFMGEGPQRGDIVVFEFPQDPGKDYIKRVVGIPGDHIRYEGKRLYLNDRPLGYEFWGDYRYRDEHGRETEAKAYLERLREPPYTILIHPGEFTSYHRVEKVVPPGHYFVMGDNRDNSNDSRFWGFVPAHRLVGRAVTLFWSWDPYESTPRWDRLGQAVE